MRFCVRRHAGLLASVGIWGIPALWIWLRMLRQAPDGLWAGSRTVWADWSAHLAYAQVAATRSPADWFTRHPLLADRPFDYPIVADAISGLLIRLGVGIVPAFLVPSVLATLALVAVLHLFYRRALGSWGSAMLAQLIFFTSGGLGWLLYLGDVAAMPPGGGLGVPPREYTLLPELGIWWSNIVTTQLLPQRALLMGVPLALGIYLSLGSRRPPSASPGTARALVLSAGVGLLAATHVHSVLALAVLCAALAAATLREWRRWSFFAGAAGLAALLVFRAVYADAATRGFLAWRPGWLAGSEPGLDLGLVLFLWLNFGVALPLVIASFVRLPKAREPIAFAGVALFAICLLVQFQPYHWDNTKLLTWAHLCLCVPMVRYLTWLWRRRTVARRLLAATLLLSLCASGGLELWRVAATAKPGFRMWTRAEQDLAERFRAITPADSVVLCADDSHHWVAPLAGRSVVLGYRGWLESYGVATANRARELAAMLAAGPGSEALLEQHRVDFIVVGPRERRRYGAEPERFRALYARVLTGAGHEIFSVTGRQAPDGTSRGER